MPKLRRVDVASLKNQSGDPQITHIRYPRRSCRRSLLNLPTNTLPHDHLWSSPACPSCVLSRQRQLWTKGLTASLSDSHARQLLSARVVQLVRATEPVYPMFSVANNQFLN